MYAGAGAADITNWARAILVADSTHVNDVFIFHAAKRGHRIGWTDEDGNRIFQRAFSHHKGDSIFWCEATDDDLERVAIAKKGGTPKTPADLKALVPNDGEVSKNVLLEASKKNGIGVNRARQFLTALIDTRELFERRVPRKGTNPESRISRNEHTLI
jgi:hypothetical protein